MCDVKVIRQVFADGDLADFNAHHCESFAPPRLRKASRSIEICTTPHVRYPR